MKTLITCCLLLNVAIAQESSNSVGIETENTEVQKEETWKNEALELVGRLADSKDKSADKIFSEIGVMLDLYNKIEDQESSTESIQIEINEPKVATLNSVKELLSNLGEAEGEKEVQKSKTSKETKWQNDALGLAGDFMDSDSESVDEIFGKIGKALDLYNKMEDQEGSNVSAASENDVSIEAISDSVKGLLNKIAEETR